MTKTLSLKKAWNLWEKVEKGWESGEPEGKKLEGQKPKEDESYKKHETIILQTKTPSGFNALEAEREFVPGKDKDAKVMQLETEIAKLEEALMELELSEAFITPDNGTSVLGRSLFSGAALEPPNGYDRNFCPDPPAPEEGTNAQDQDASATLIAPKQFVPKEDLSRVMEAIEWNRKTRLAKLF
jgi:hypothetical protein